MYDAPSSPHYSRGVVKVPENVILAKEIMSRKFSGFSEIFREHDCLASVEPGCNTEELATTRRVIIRPVKNVLT